MWTAILEFLNNLFKSFPLFAKYFPPKSTEAKVQDGAKQIDDQIAKEESTGRPQ